MTHNTTYPEFFRVRQRFESHRIEDIAQSVEQTLATVDLASKILPGQTVAIAVGSRGIANLPAIVAALVRGVRAVGGSPLVIPAMGSHGGATGEGQAAMLASLGIDADSVGCPIVASMETIVVGTTADGLEIHFDKHAAGADHVIVVNRVKPHTRLVGSIESGLTKMLMIGLGKHRGAVLFHQFFPQYDFRLDRLAPSVIPMIIDQMPITLGIAIVEDAFEQTSLIEAIQAKEILSREPELLRIAKARMPRLPFDQVDLLLIDKIGKEISGTGMDTNVIGRKTNDRVAAPDEMPKVREIYVRRLSEKSTGNASGIGIAEYCHQRVIAAMNADVTRINCVTSAHVSAGAIPLTFASDRDVLDAVRSQVGHIQTDALRWIRIADTLNVSELACSRGYWNEAQQRDDLDILSQPAPLEFDSEGNLVDHGGGCKERVN